MIQIIIFFVVISVISNIIKSAGKQRQSQSARTMGGNIDRVKDIETPEAVSIGTIGEVRERKMDRGVKMDTVKDVTPLGADPYKIKTTKHERGRVKPALQYDTKSNFQANVGLSSLNPSRLVEGIILSEILAPPKSRRQGLR